MSANNLTPLTESRPEGSRWQELRDDAGRLYARLDERRLLLEVSYHRERVTFDLRDYMEVLRGLDNSIDLD
jgi:hypothetical protein